MINKELFYELTGLSRDVKLDASTPHLIRKPDTGTYYVLVSYSDLFRTLRGFEKFRGRIQRDQGPSQPGDSRSVKSHEALFC